jgi:hypothetical protein
MDAGKKKTSEEKLQMEKLPPNKIPNPIISRLKKVGFSVWLTVMIIGGVLAFLTALLLL